MKSAQRFRKRMPLAAKEAKMIAMKFAPFLTLLIIGFIAAVVMHSGFRYQTSQGSDGFFAKWIAGWIGGWLGSPVLGHWWFQIQNVYVIPALVGAFIGAFSLIYWRKATAIAATTPKAVVTVATQPEMHRKVS
jgi:uncharacterized membrane protein YeaQ/YmgE (transglycosylase-associated protein family)